MINCFLVDDEPNAVKLLDSILTDVSQECTVVGTAHTIEDALEGVEKLQIDLLFLDIKLGNTSGFDLLDKIDNINFQVVFTTAFSQYAIKAFEYNAVHYLLKPLDAEKVASLVKKLNRNKGEQNQQNLLAALDFIKSQKQSRVAIPSLERTEFIDLTEIEYLQGDGSYTIILLLNGSKITSSRPMGYFEKLLPADIFCRIHKRYMANVEHIKEIEKGRSPTLFMRSGAILPVSAGNREPLMRLLGTRIHF
jgi:two-component system LytT family response regulator